MTRVAIIDEVGCEVSRHEIPDLPETWTERQRLVAAAALVAADVACTENFEFAQDIGTPQRISDLAAGVRALVLTWGDREHMWAIVIEDRHTADEAAVDAALTRLVTGEDEDDEDNGPTECPRCGARYADDPSCGKVVHESLPDRPADVSSTEQEG